MSAPEPNSGTTDVDARIDELRHEHPAKKGMMFNLIVTAVEVGGAILLFRIARNAGASDTAAYLIGAIAPVLGALAVWIRSRKLSGASAAIFAFAIISAIIAIVGSTEPKVLLYKDCGSTALVGLIFLGSCVLTRPLIFYFAQRWGTDGTHDGMQTFDLMWDAYPRFRTGMYAMTVVWGGVFLVQGAVTALIVAATPFDTGYTWDQVLPFVAMGVAIVLTGIISKRVQRAPTPG